MTHVFKCHLVTKTEILLDKEVEYLDLPGEEGPFTLLAHHTPLVGLLTQGKVRAKVAGEENIIEIPIKKGLLEMSYNEVVVLIDPLC